MTLNANMQPPIDMQVTCLFLRSLRLFAAAVLLIVLTVRLPVQAQERPLNFVVVNVDDLGWTDLSAQGSLYYETPHIDGLAAEGMRFTDGYAAAAICSPSRAALLTGRYPARIGITDWIRARFQGGEIPADRRNPTAYVGEADQALRTPPNPLWMEHEEVTLAEVLQEAGYTTAHIGKWHLGADAWYPETQGFDYNLGGSDYGQPPSYFDPYFKEGQGRIPTLAPRREDEYLTDREADEAVRFIRQHAEGPFFLYYAPYAVHTPIQAKDSLIARYEGKPKTQQDDPVYAAMVHSVDEAVGRILGALEEAGLADETVVLFTSDNGGLEGPTDNDPLRSGKGYPYEGGLRVPFIVRWPGVVPPATVSYEPVMGIDVLPTILEAAGLPLPAGRVIDGISLVAHLRSGGRAALGREALYWHFPHYRQGHRIPPYSIVRRGDWKLIKWHEGSRYELYHLEADLGETTDLTEENPEQVAELDAALSAWLDRAGAKETRPNPDYEAAR